MPAVVFKQFGDGTATFENTADAVPDQIFGGPATPTVASPRYMGKRIAKVPLAAAVDTGGGVLSWANPHSYSVIVERVMLDITTVATGTCGLDVGYTATSATTSANNLLTALDVNTATGVFDNITEKGASGKSRVKMASGKWITASKASGTSTGLAGYAYIEYIPAT